MEFVEKEVVQRIRDEKFLKQVITEALNENPMCIIEYKQGKQSAFNMLVSQALKKTKGYGDPETIRRILKKML